MAMSVAQMKLYERNSVGRELIIFGAGMQCAEFVEVTGLKPKYFVDNSPNKINTEFCGRMVRSPEALTRETVGNVYIIVACNYYFSVSRQLNSMGFAEFTDFTDIFCTDEIINGMRDLAKYKDIHTGKRAFIIGNGTNLQAADLDKLKEEITFGVNRIYKSFEKTCWRPTYYGIVDVEIARSFHDEISAQVDAHKFVTVNASASFVGASDISYFRYCMELGPNAEFQFSKDCTERVFHSQTVVGVVLQIAFYMGIGTVYLLGVENSLGRSTAAVQNHFYDDNNEEKRIADIITDYNAHNLATELEYQAAEKAYTLAGRKIYNASRATRVEAFERVNFDEIIF